nr:hypothetical protein B0A51_10199 [Rachicladosporium sp. CCFEE 5018]
MAARKHLLGRRRSDGDDDESAMVGDSQSEGSAGSVVGDREESTVADVKPGQQSGDAQKSKSMSPDHVNGSKGMLSLARKSQEESEKPSFKASADTEGMMRGLSVDETPDEVLDFEDVGDSVSVAAEKRAQPVQAPSGNIRIDRPIDRQRREHEEYRRKRDADPAFIPNRGNFFMHDTRGSPTTRGPAPERGGFTGRGRGRGFGGPNVAGFQPPREPTWKHDLHEVINEEPPAAAAAPQAASLTRDQEESARIFPKTNSLPQRQPPATAAPQATAFVLGKVPVRVSLPGMSKAITMQQPLAVKRHMRFPDHRPPLRRDKPVRVYLYGYGPKYIFPSADRSFVFIPRQLRPNQRGYGSNTYQRGNISYGPHSRRTSVFGGSMYSASVAASRRSSIAGRDGAFSPASFSSSFHGQPRPFVNLPPGGRMYSNGTSPAPLSGYQTPTGQIMHTYPLPQKPMMTGTPTVALHQPRPQKTISVTGIESPAALQQARRPSSSSSQQPFHNQLPAHMTEQPVYAQQQGQYYAPGPTYDFAPQVSASGTPLLGIPEQAMHGQNFHPPNMYYSQYPPQQQPYYYGQPAPMQMYMPPAGPLQQQYVAQSPTHQQAPLSHPTEALQAPSGMVAHESNGMVFYLPAADVAQQPSAPSATEYQPAESFVPAYAMPGLPPPTPGPEESGYYYPAVDAGGQNWGYGTTQ